MSGKPHDGGAYKSPRPISPRGRIISLPVKTSRGVSIINCCDTGELASFIAAVMRVGYVCCFTETSDGGAVSLTVYDGEIRYKSWARSADELLICYRDLLTAIRGEE